MPTVPTTTGKIPCKVLKASPRRVHARNENFNRKEAQRVSKTQRSDLLPYFRS